MGGSDAAERAAHQRHSGGTQPEGALQLQRSIQPDEGENMTVFVVHYHLPYTGKYTFNAKVTMPVNSFVYAAEEH